MSRYVTISTVAPPPYRIAEGSSIEAAYSGLKDYICNNLLKVLCERPDLVVLPEACGLPNACVPGKNAYLDHDDMGLLDAVAGFAREYKTNIIYPSMVNEHGRRYNSLRLIGRDGNIAGRYDKAYSYLGEIEEWDVTPGKMPCSLMQSDIGTLAGVICFDLNSENLRKHYAALKPDIVVFSSMYHGGFKQALWAHECEAYFVSSLHGLPSGVTSPTGQILSLSNEHYCYSTARANLDGALFHLDYNMERIDRAKQKYGPAIKIDDPGCLGSVYLSVEVDDLNIDSIVEEFNLERLDDYFARVSRITDSRRL